GGYLTITDRKSQQLSIVANRFNDKTIESYSEEYAPLDERRLSVEDMSTSSIKKGSELLDSQS
ncbi:hypothetical protein, partial [Oleiphilus sp. HI0061]